MEILLILGCALIVGAAYVVRWKLAYNEERDDLNACLTMARREGDAAMEAALQEQRLDLDLYGPTVLRKRVRP